MTVEYSHPPEGRELGYDAVPEVGILRVRQSAPIVNPDADGFTGLSTIEDAIRAISDGQMVIVVDDEDRENEGDLILAASKATAEQIAFMIRHTSGIICASITTERARTLQLDLMVRDNSAPLRTAFTVSVDYRDGLTTGISAKERTSTLHALANHNIGAADFVRPGHVFPLVANEGGVLVRSGHTEAATDLMKLAGLPEVGVLSELVNDDGTVKRLPELFAFAHEFQLKIVSIADLIAYRRRSEQLVERVAEFEVETKIGTAKAITYATRFDSVQHLALIFGSPSGVGVPVRIHREQLIADVFLHRNAGPPNVISAALDKIKSAGCGIVVYLREGGIGVRTSDTYDNLDVGAEPRTQSEATREEDWREVGIGAQILKDIGVTSLTLLTKHNFDYVGLPGFDLQIIGREIVD